MDELLELLVNEHREDFYWFLHDREVEFTDRLFEASLAFGPYPHQKPWPAHWRNYMVPRRI